MTTSSVKAGEAYVEIATRQGTLNRGLAAAATRIGAFGKAVGTMSSGIASKLDFGGAFSLIPALVKIGAVAIGVLGTAVSGAIGLFTSLIGGLISLIGWPALIIAGVVALGAAVMYYTGAGSAALEMFAKAWQWLLDVVLPVVNAILQSLMSGDFARAGEILWTSLQLLWMEGVKSLYGMWIDFRNQFLSTLDPLVQPMMEIWIAVKDVALMAWSAISSAWTTTASTITSVFGGIQASWGTTVQSMSDMWNDTVNWIAKKLLYLYSLFDWSVDYEAAAKDMDAQNEAKKKANREGAQKRKESRNEEAEILKDSFDDEIDQLRKKLKSDMAGVSDKGLDLKMPDLGGIMDKFKEFSLKIPEMSGFLGRRTESAGTFSGFNALAIGAQNTDEATKQRAQMLRTMEAQAKIERKIFDAIQQNAGVLGARP